MIRLKLKPGREASVIRRHPWLFSGAVGSREGDGSDGLAEVVDSDGRVLARGSYSPESQIVARLWTFDGRSPDPSLFQERFQAARRLRRETVAPETTGFRAINSEGDLCPGVLMDVYGDAAVLELLTEGTEKWEADLTRAAWEVFNPQEILVRRTGVGRDRRSRLAERAADRGQGATSSRLVPFAENGLTFFADVSGGQKTGFFLDQRENRIRLRSLAAGRTVLNLFSYTGAFSVAALAGGATRAVDVDVSEAALDLARQHRRANGFEAGDSDFVRADVFEDLRLRGQKGEAWGVVVCDPPAFAKKRGDVPKAARGYKDINRLAMELVEPGGWLLTCSCSGQVTADLFQKIVFSASVDAGRSFSLAARQGAGADHPVSLDCPEGEYLKGLWLMREGLKD
jgi:23S rRNA (cytosine1962-C5)-methyltransferase